MDDLKLIKKFYGEKMMHLCRDLFPTILEEEGVLFDLLDKHFDHSRELYDDIVKNSLIMGFKSYIYELMNKDIEIANSTKNPFELMNDAGYNLYECHNEKEIQSFKKYYSKGEELCTFNGNRLDTNYVFFAVKHNVDEIKRKDYKAPERQDLYGTSVISIQFNRGNTNYVSIKNRYNHTVQNPDATFSNNLDNIIPGLTEAFEREYGYKISKSSNSTFEIPNYVVDIDGKYHKYYMEVNNKYYCKNNLIIDNFEVVDLYKDKEKYLFADYFIIDLQKGTIFAYDYSLKKDSFLYGLTGILNIQVINEGNHKNICIKPYNGNNIYIELDNNNHIISYVNNNIEFVGSFFLMYNNDLKRLQMNNVKRVGYNFLYYNNSIEELEMNSLETIDNFFLRNNNSLKRIYLPNVKNITHDFLRYNTVLEEINMPNLEFAGIDFLKANEELTEISFPNLKYTNKGFIQNNQIIKHVYLPKVSNLCQFFLNNNVCLEELDLESVTKIESPILRKNSVIKKLYLPNLEVYEENKSYSNNIYVDELINENLNRNKLLLRSK